MSKWSHATWNFKLWAYLKQLVTRELGIAAGIQSCGLTFLKASHTSSNQRQISSLTRPIIPQTITSPRPNVPFIPVSTSFCQFLVSMRDPAFLPPESPVCCPVLIGCKRFLTNGLSASRLAVGSGSGLRGWQILFSHFYNYLEGEHRTQSLPHRGIFKEDANDFFSPLKCVLPHSGHFCGLSYFLCVCVCLSLTYIVGIWTTAKVPDVVKIFLSRWGEMKQFLTFSPWPRVFILIFNRCQSISLLVVTICGSLPMYLNWLSLKKK